MDRFARDAAKFLPWDAEAAWSGPPPTFATATGAGAAMWWTVSGRGRSLRPIAGLTLVFSSLPARARLMRDAGFDMPAACAESGEPLNAPSPSGAGRWITCHALKSAGEDLRDRL